MVREIHRCRAPCRRSYVENTDARVGAGGVRWSKCALGIRPASGWCEPSAMWVPVRSSAGEHRNKPEAA